MLPERSRTVDRLRRRRTERPPAPPRPAVVAAFAGGPPPASALADRFRADSPAVSPSGPATFPARFFTRSPPPGRCRPPASGVSRRPRLSGLGRSRRRRRRALRDRDGFLLLLRRPSITGRRRPWPRTGRMRPPCAEGRPPPTVSPCRRTDAADRTTRTTPIPPTPPRRKTWRSRSRRTRPRRRVEKDEPIFTSEGMEMFTEIKSIPPASTCRPRSSCTTSNEKKLAPSCRRTPPSVELPVRNGTEAFKRLQSVLKAHHVDSPSTPRRRPVCTRPPLHTNYVLYTEDLTADELGQVLQQLGVEDKKEKQPGREPVRPPGGPPHDEIRSQGTVGPAGRRSGADAAAEGGGAAGRRSAQAGGRRPARQLTAALGRAKPGGKSGGRTSHARAAVQPRAAQEGLGGDQALPRRAQADATGRPPGPAGAAEFRPRQRTMNPVS